MLVKKMAVLFVLGLSIMSAKSNLVSELMSIVEEAEDKKVESRKILNNAFEQRMKTQKMARDAILIFMDFNTSFFQKNLLESGDGFNSKFEDLMRDEKSINRVVAELPEFKRKIDEFKSIWGKFYESVKKLSKDAKDKGAFEYIIKSNLTLLNDTDYIFSNLLPSSYSKDKLEASMAHIEIMLITQVGKPRMYITKALKERFLIKADIDKIENSKILKGTIKDMDRLMKALKDGDKELELDGTEDRDILEKLAISQKIWNEFKKIIDKKELSSGDLNTLIAKNEDFIKAHSEVLRLIRASNDN
jgi:hypothetical protein